jgi:hypothetical protein
MPLAVVADLASDVLMSGIIKSMFWVLIAAAAVLAWYGLHRLAVWAEARGWIFYKNKRGPLGGFGMALIDATTPFAPEIEHSIEEQQSERMRADVTRSGSAPHKTEIFLDSVDSDETRSSS